MRRRQITRSDEGETLVELIIAITILAVAVIAIGSGITLSVVVSKQHREQSTADDLLHDFAETLQTAYAPCNGSTVSTASTIAGNLASAVPSYFVLSASVQYWDPTSQLFSTSTSCPGTDPGLQQVTLNLKSTDLHANESLTVAVRSNS